MAYIYIDVDIEEHLGEVDNATLIKELNSRGYIVYNHARIEVTADNDGVAAKSSDFKRQMCDILDLGYHVPKQKIVEEIAERI